jgi:hypothetical protein
LCLAVQSPMSSSTVAQTNTRTAVIRIQGLGISIAFSTPFLHELVHLIKAHHLTVDHPKVSGVL